MWAVAAWRPGARTVVQVGNPLAREGAGWRSLLCCPRRCGVTAAAEAVALRLEQLGSTSALGCASQVRGLNGCDLTERMGELAEAAQGEVRRALAEVDRLLTATAAAVERRDALMELATVLVDLWGEQEAKA